MRPLPLEVFLASPYDSFLIYVLAAQIIERCPPPVTGIRVRLHSCSPKGKNTTAQGRDALVAHPGFQATERPDPEGVAHRFGSGIRPAWNPFRVRFRPGPWTQGARP